jgi:hypothetical protein
MKVQRLTQTDWDAALSAVPCAEEPYFQHAYHAAHTETGWGEPAAWTITDGPNRLFIAGLKTQIPGPDALFDLQTPNGYGGPLANTHNDSFLHEAWTRWREDAADQGIVAAFFRLHPLLDNARSLPTDAEIRNDRQTISIDLSAGAEAALAHAHGSHRNMIARSQREPHEILWNPAEAAPAFANLYTSHMQRLNANPELRFEAGYFTRIAEMKQVSTALLLLKGAVVAGAQFLFGSKYAHYHLSARTEDGPNWAANALLHAAAQRAAAQGCCALHLGGGRTPAPEDTLLAFKRRIGTLVHTFQVARVVSSPNNFQRLTRAWSDASGRSPQWLLPYRQPLTGEQP